MEKKKITSAYRLGKRIQKARKAKGLTQEELAEKIRTSATWVAFMETGRSTPNLAMLQKVARALGKRAKDLIPY